jgi:glycosyltransferase involved in cell wall biosynthesis
MKTKVVILHNIIAPYKTILFNELFRICDSLTVIYIAETEDIREWEIDSDEELRFPYEVMYKGSLNNVNKFKIMGKTWRYLNSLQPEVIVIGGYRDIACWAGFLWARLNGKKVILWSSTNEGDKPRRWYKERIKRLLVARCDAANVYGTKSRDYLIKLGMKKEKIFIEGNVTDNNYYREETAKYKENKDELLKDLGLPQHNFIYVGRFSPEKNLMFLLESFNELQSSFENNWGLLLVGNGPQRELIENTIAGKKIERVFLPGYKQREEIPLFLALSDVFVLPSVSETWGLAVNEAMAAGMPILVSNKCGCYPDIVRDGINGYSFDPYDRGTLITTMRKMVENGDNLQEMAKASISIIKEYSPERAAQTIFKTIEYVMSRRP